MSMEPQSELITVGCEVEVELISRSGDKERLSLVIVQDDAADFAQGYLSEKTPLAKALIGEKVGNIIPYMKDDILAIHVLQVSKAEQKPLSDASARREAMRRKAMQEVQDTSAMVFASSFSGKWGDYDPDSIPKKIEPEDEEGDDIT